MILTARLALLWDLGRRYLPHMISLLEQFARFIGTSEEEARLDALYGELAFHDFSSDLLQNCTQSDCGFGTEGGALVRLG